MDRVRIVQEEEAVAFMLPSDLPFEVAHRRWALELEPGVWVITEADGQSRVANVAIGD